LTEQDNPKKAYGDRKVPLGLVPASALVYAALAMQDGAEKYGAYNWREKPVRSTTFYHAALRHLLAWFDGEEDAEDSGVPHLAHALACIAIIVDAKETGHLLDDRPPKGGAARVLKRYETPKATPGGYPWS